MSMRMQCCGFPGCSNEYPDHYMLDVCGARHVLAIVSQGWQAEVVLSAKRFELTTPNHVITPVIPDELVLLPDLALGVADVLMVLVTDAQMVRVVADMLERVDSSKLLVVVPGGEQVLIDELTPAGDAIKIAVSTKEGFERLKGFLKRPRMQTDINA